MSLSDLASLGSFVSGFAVLVSLVFLYFQLRQLSEQGRQAEKNQKAFMQQERAARMGDHMRFLADPRNVEVFLKVRSGAPDITPIQFRQYVFFFRASLANHEDAFFQHQQKLLDETSFESTLALLRLNFSDPGYRAMWKLLRVSFEKSFRDFMDQLLSEVEVVSPKLLEGELAAWHKNFAGELASA